MKHVKAPPEDNVPGMNLFRGQLPSYIRNDMTPLVSFAKHDWNFDKQAKTLLIPKNPQIT